MKRIIIIALAALSVAFAACTNDSELRKAVEQFSKSCPTSLGEYATLDNVDYENHTVTMYYTMADGIFNFDALKANDKSFRNNMLKSYANNNEKGFAMFIDEIIKANAGMRLVFKDHQGNSHEMLISPEELKKNRPNPDASPDEMLKAMTDNTKLQLPEEVDECMIMTDVILDDNNYIFVYNIDESLYDIDIMRENSEIIKGEMLKELKSDPLMTKTCNLIKKTGRGLVYKFVGLSSNDTYSLYISNNEI